MNNLLRLIHVDDDIDTLKIFKESLAGQSFLQYQGGFSNAESALNFIEINGTDLLVLDVEMPGNDGLWLAGQLKGRKIPIVFLTSHMGYALAAFEALAFDYLLKPINKELVSNLLMRYSMKMGMAASVIDESIEEMTHVFSEKENVIRKIFLPTNGTTEIIKVEELMYIKSSASYSHFVMQNRLQHISSRHLKVYADCLALHPDFVRIHRSALVNKNFIKSIGRKGKDSWLEMEDGEKLDISERLKENIMELIK